MKANIEAALDEIRIAFPGCGVSSQPDGSGGEYVVVEGLDIGGQYAPSASWVGFRLEAAYPDPDVYPHFISPDIVRRDGQPLGEGLSGPTDWNGRRAIQVSRRTNNWNGAVDTACNKLIKVLLWLRGRP